MSKAPLNGKAVAEQYLAALRAYDFGGARKLLKQRWTAPEAAAFIAALDAPTLEVLAPSVDMGGPELEKAFRARSSADPAAAARLALGRLKAGEPVAAADLSAASNADLALTAAALVSDADGYKRLVALLAALPPDRRAALGLTGVAAEIAALLAAPDSPAPQFEAEVARGLRSDFQTGFVEDRPNPVAYATSRFSRFPLPLRSRAAEVLRRLAGDGPETGFDGRTVASWAAETIDSLVHAGELAG